MSLGTQAGKVFKNASTNFMRDDLVGYVLNALDEPELKRVEMALADPNEGPELRRDFECLRRSTAVVSRDRGTITPPQGLAERTTQFVRSRAAEKRPTPRAFTSEAAQSHGGAPRAWLDRIIIAATAMAACVLIGPLLLDAIGESRARRVERNLVKVSGALEGYAQSHRIFPSPPDSGSLSRAGLYAPTLVSEERLVADDGTLLCPDTVLSNRKNFRVPTLDELKAAVGTPEFEVLLQSMGGDYGYTLGHRDVDGRLQPISHLNRTHHPIMADTPDDNGEKSSNHPGGLHYVLYEDGHVERLFLDDISRNDHLFKNHAGQPAAGIDPNDAVIGSSHRQP